ncbi:MAG: VOC family protein [Thermotogaceae bacterium]|jgi:catechol 2,3-dioxygenase-like lactoylglutathione lyase family enzyme|nr:VOC family protein [Thermotogaceae bacterium]
MKINGAIFFLGCHSLEKINEFYQGFLGLELFRDQRNCRIYSVPSGGMIGFCEHLPVEAGTLSPIMTFLTEFVDDFHEKAIKLGMAPDRPSINEKFGIYHFFLKDPEGYRVEIQKFLD